MRRTLFSAVLTITMALPAVAGAEQAADPDPSVGQAPTETTVVDDATSAPTTTREASAADPAAADPAAVPEAPVGAEAAGGETAVSVATEQQYRDAITTLSADGSGPHTIPERARHAVIGR